MIPYITTYYQVGDRIQGIDGRNVSLQTNVGIDQGEAPSYPWVVGVSWIFEGDRQQTVIQLSDRQVRWRTHERPASDPRPAVEHAEGPGS